MIEPSPSTLLGEAPATLRAPRAAVRAYVASVAALGAAMMAALLMVSVATDTGAEAERIAGMQDSGYGATLVSALAVNVSRPIR